MSALGDTMTVGIVRLGSQAAKLGLQPGEEIAGIRTPNDRQSRYWFVLPALLLFGLVFWLQRRRKAGGVATGAAP